MSYVEELMIDFYNTLVQIKYPKITTATAKNVKLTILSGENRLSLLSWLLTEKSPTVAAKLQKLKGDALKEELFKCYSEIGICNDKKLLLGNCPLEKQLSILRLLLDFIKSVFIEPLDTEPSNVDINDILNVYINEDPSIVTCNIKPKLNYSESVQYFEDLQNNLNEHKELSPNDESVKKENLDEHFSEDEKKESNEVDQDVLLNERMKQFIEAFSSLTPDAANTKNNLYSMDADINDIYSNFSSLVQFLQAQEEIANTNVPEGINELDIPLSKIVADAVKHTEEARKMCTDNY